MHSLTTILVKRSQRLPMRDLFTRDNNNDAGGATTLFKTTRWFLPLFGFAFLGLSVHKVVLLKSGLKISSVDGSGDTKIIQGTMR